MLNNDKRRFLQGCGLNDENKKTTQDRRPAYYYETSNYRNDINIPICNMNNNLFSDYDAKFNNVNNSKFDDVKCNMNKNRFAGYVPSFTTQNNIYFYDMYSNNMYYNCPLRTKYPYFNYDMSYHDRFNNSRYYDFQIGTN